MSRATKAAVAVPQETVTTVAVRPVPRVDLLPGVIRQRVKVRRARRLSFGVAGAAVVAVCGLYVVAMQERSAAEAELTTAQSAGQRLASQAASYAEVPQVFAAAESAQGTLGAAMVGEILWSSFLEDMSRFTPRGVGLTSFSATVNDTPKTSVATPGEQAGLPGAPGTPVDGYPKIGSITFEGEARDVDAVAAWLDALAKQSTLVNPYATRATREEPGGAGPVVVSFSSTADLSPAAFSGRYVGPEAVGRAVPGTAPTTTGVAR